MKEITVEELKEKIENKEYFVLLDVRELFESHIARLDIPSIQIPVDDLPSRIGELKPEEEIVVMCRSGNTSTKATQLLEEKGFTNVSNLKGGINEWAKKIDTSLPQY